MKKLITVLLAVAMVFTLAACGSSNPGNNGGNDAVVTDPLAVLTKVWDSYTEDEKFPAAGGDYNNNTDGKPGAFDVSDTDNLEYLLTFPAANADLIDNAASIIHMMNTNTFSCGAFHVKNAADTQTLAQALRDNIQSRQWMCGFPDKLVILTVGDYVIAEYGATDLCDTFKDHAVSLYPSAKVVYDEAIQ